MNYYNCLTSDDAFFLHVDNIPKVPSTETCSNWEHVLQSLDEFYCEKAAAGAPFTLVFDIRQMSIPDTQHIMQAVKLFGKHSDTSERLLKETLMLLTPLGRRTLDMLFTLYRPRRPVIFASTLEELQPEQGALFRSLEDRHAVVSHAL